MQLLLHLEFKDFTASEASGIRTTCIPFQSGAVFLMMLDTFLLIIIMFYFLCVKCFRLLFACTFCRNPVIIFMEDLTPLTLNFVVRRNKRKSLHCQTRSPEPRQQNPAAMVRAWASTHAQVHISGAGTHLLDLQTTRLKSEKLWV